jgi:hypothetical protein
MQSVDCWANKDKVDGNLLIAREVYMQLLMHYFDGRVIDCWGGALDGIMQCWGHQTGNVTSR